MAVTASRLGSAPITLDWSHLLKKHDPDAELLNQTWNLLKKRLNSQDVGFYDCPINPAVSQIQESQALAESLLSRNQFTDCLLLGIGGSALGPLSLLSSLQEKRSHPIQFHFLENPDPLDCRSTFKRLRPE